MPKGVEHLDDASGDVNPEEPRNSVMPKGVEHTAHSPLMLRLVFRETP